MIGKLKKDKNTDCVGNWFRSYTENLSGVHTDNVSMDKRLSSNHILEGILPFMDIHPFRDMHGMIGRLCILKNRLDQKIQLRVTIIKKNLGFIKVDGKKEAIIQCSEKPLEWNSNSLLQLQLELTTIFHLLWCQLMR